MRGYGGGRLDVRPGDRVRPFHNGNVSYGVEEVDGDRMRVSRTYVRRGETFRSEKTVANDAGLWEVVRGD